MDENLNQSIDEAVEAAEPVAAEESIDETINEKTDETNEEAVDEAFDGEVKETVDTLFPEQSAETPAPKKKKIHTPIIIAAVILVLAIIAGAVFFIFFNNSVVGTWVFENDASSDEANGGNGQSLRYYIFEQDGTAKIALGSMEVVGYWSYAKDDQSTTDQVSNKIDVNISYYFTGQFDFTVEGNAFTGKTLTLTGYGNDYKFKSATKPEPKIDVPKEFKADNEVVGKWKNDQENVTYNFKNDGTCELNQMDMLIITGTYSVDKKSGAVSINYVDEKDNNLSITYKVKDKNTITFSNLDYKKVS